jgi:hypothetical protein
VTLTLDFGSPSVLPLSAGISRDRLLSSPLPYPRLACYSFCIALDARADLRKLRTSRRVANVDDEVM